MDALNMILERMERAKQNAQKAAAEEPRVHFECEKCQDTEWVMKVIDGYNFATPCDCREKKVALRLMASSGIRAEDMKKGFAEFETFGESGLINAKQTAARYCKDFEQIRESRNNSLLLCGASGRGKTTLGMIVANVLLNKCVGVRYMAYRDDMTRLKQLVTDEHAYDEQIYRLKTAKVLFVDDMLKGKLTESDVNIMYEIINYRYLERLPVIISTEKTTNELLDFDEAIGSRILEMCKGYVVSFGSEIPNYRMR